MTWTSHTRLPFDGRPLWVVAAQALLVLIVALAQLVALLAWLGGAHATMEQITLHEEAVERGHYHHHGALQHYEHQLSAVLARWIPSTLRPRSGPSLPLLRPMWGLFKSFSKRR